jgi:GTP cyclohydrolase II
MKALAPIMKTLLPAIRDSDPINRGGLPVASISASVPIPLPNGARPQLSVFDGLLDGDADHFALTFLGKAEESPWVRLHSSCLTGDVLGSMRCDCGPQLDDAINRFSRDGGTIIYLQQEGRGIGLAKKIAAYRLQDEGADTFEANRRVGALDDPRDYRVGAQMLLALGLRKIRLLTNNPDKVAQLGRWGIDVVAVEPTLISMNEHNQRYLTAKRDLAGHSLALSLDAKTGEKP